MKSLIFILSLLSLRAAAEDVVPAKLPEGTAKVTLLLYDYTASEEQRQIEVAGKMHPGVIDSHTKTLKETQIGKLLEALTQNHEPKTRYTCEFAPHHAVIFHDKDGKILGSVSICFSCREIHSKTFPRTGSESLFYSYWGWVQLRELFIEAGLPIHDNDEDYTAMRKSLRK